VDDLGYYSACPYKRRQKVISYIIEEVDRAIKDCYDGTPSADAYLGHIKILIATKIQRCIDGSLSVYQIMDWLNVWRDPDNIHIIQSNIHSVIRRTLSWDL